MAKLGLNPTQRSKKMAITEELLGELIRDYKKPEDLLGESGLLKQLTKRLLERAMKVSR